MKTVTGKLSILVICLAAAGMMVAFTGCSNQPSGNVKYQCPMHPTIIQDHPGDCPICGMRLVPMKDQPAPATNPPPAPPAASYSCPMHPEVTSDRPGQCPKCGMNLEPVKPKSGTDLVPPENTASGERKILFYRSPMDPKITSPTPMKDEMGMDFVPVYEEERAAPAGVAGLAPVRVNQAGIELAGVRTALAVRGRLRSGIRAYGTVVADESRVRQVRARITGYVEKLFVNTTGQAVKQGEPILSLYSPELLASQEEFLRARETAARLGSADPQVQAEAESLAAAARERLLLFDVPPGFVAELERTGKARRAVTLVAPVSGFVTVKSIYEGELVDPSMELFYVTDLSRVWVEAEFYEYEAPQIKLGDAASITTGYDPALALTAKVSYIYPYLNTESRTVKARFEFDNPDLALKPGMYVNVALDRETEEAVIVPDSAVIDSGPRRVVFVEEAAGSFVPREVKTGVRGEGQVQILSGLNAGERVVVQGNFLIDSESRLRAAIVEAQTPAESPK
jgi:RND family efflux transporter MFP subunit